MFQECSVVNILVGHLESLTISGLRLDGDLERLWWKLFIHVNSDLSEISQEQLWLLDTSASRGRQSVAKMMTPLWVICIQLSQSSSGGDQRLGNSSVSSQRSHGTTSTKADSVRSRTHRSDPTRSHPGDLVGKYGVQASATDLEALPFGPNPHWAILPWGTLFSMAPLGLGQNARWKDLLLATGLIGQLRKGQFSSHWSTDRCTLNILRSHRDPVIPVPVRPVSGNIGHTGYTGKDQAQPVTPGALVTPDAPVTPGASVRLVNTGQKAQKVQANHCLDRSELFVLNSPVRPVQLEHNVHESLGNMPSVQDEHSSEHSQAFQGLLISDSPDDKADESPERSPLCHSGHRSSGTGHTGNCSDHEHSVHRSRLVRSDAVDHWSILYKSTGQN